MSTEGRVARNTVWLVFQPLLLNAISIFAMAYITRTLGTADYGRFTLVFALAAMFAPLSNMGLRAVTVREIAANKEQTSVSVSKMLGTRGVLACLTAVAMTITVWALGYDTLTMKLAVIASGTLIVQALSSTLQDAFQAHERSSLVAYSQFVGGFILTLLSCLVLYLGFGVLALASVYVVGGAITLFIASRSMRKMVTYRIEFDRKVAIQTIIQAAPFFVPTIIAVVSSRFGTLLLSKFANETAVGLFGAAYALTDRLGVISDGVGTAIYPALSALYPKSKEDAAKLFRTFFEYVVILALPMAVGVTLLARPIITLVCGDEFMAAAPVLTVLVWGVAANFATAMLFWALEAIRLERPRARVSVISAVVCLVCNAIFIPLWAEVGTAFASLVATAVNFVLARKLIADNLASELMTYGRLARVSAACIAMGAVVYFIRDLPVILPILAGAVVYGLALLAFGAVSYDELSKTVRQFAQRKRSAS